MNRPRGLCGALPLLLGLALAAAPGAAVAREKSPPDPWLAMTVSGVTIIEARRAGLETPRGTYVHACGPGSIGDAAGLRIGDVVLEIEGRPAEPPQLLLQYLEAARPGDRVRFKVWRDRATVDVDRPMGGRGEGTAPAAVATAPPLPTSLDVESVRVTPEAVAAGGKFALEVTFTATDPRATDRTLPVSLSYAIERDGRTLFAPAAETIAAANGQRWHVVKHLSATRESGEYTLRVELRHGNDSARATAGLTVN